VNERLIYEWLRPELKGKEWRKEYNGMTWGALYRREDMQFDWWVPLPPLDMNTAFSEGIPKLTKEGCDVKFTHGAWDLQPMRKPWHGPYYARSDFWLAVDEYLEAK